MPLRIVHLTDELDSIVESLVKSGHYVSAGEAIRSALRLLQREELDYAGKVDAFRCTIEEGLESGDSEPGTFDRIFACIDRQVAPSETREDACGITA
jgi:antitoxin ParD1/3/4